MIAKRKVETKRIYRRSANPYKTEKCDCGWETRIFWRFGKDGREMCADCFMEALPTNSKVTVPYIPTEFL